MIRLSLHDGNVYVWSAQDWHKLREEHRIVGNLVGSLSNLPRQDAFHGLPLLLLPEEVALLVEKKIGQVTGYKKITDENAGKSKDAYNNYKEKNQQEQISYYEEERKKQVESMIDRIIEGKRRKLNNVKFKKDDNSSNGKEEPVINREAILKSELEKCSAIPLTNTLVQTFTADVWNKDSVTSEVEWKFPECPMEKLRYETYKDLWGKGYYITSGQKFGGDFLIYPGDPLKFHAQFIVACVDSEKPISAYDIITYGRLGSSTRKTVVIASIPKDSSSVVYQSLTWAENS